MYQLRNLIGRSNVSPKPVKAFNQCSDFFKLVVVCHVLASALKHLSMASLADTPNIRGVQEVRDLWLETAEKRKYYNLYVGKLWTAMFAFSSKKCPPRPTIRSVLCNLWYKLIIFISCVH